MDRCERAWSGPLSASHGPRTQSQGARSHRSFKKGLCFLFVFFFWFVFLKAISIFECTPSLSITSGSCYSLIWIIGLKTVCSKAF